MLKSGGSDAEQEEFNDLRDAWFDALTGLRDSVGHLTSVEHHDSV